MEQLKPLGRRDILGILLPGVILVFAGGYALFGLLALLGLPVGSPLQQQFLLSVVLIVVAYLPGGLLRLSAAGGADRRSGDDPSGAWREERRSRGESASPWELVTGREDVGAR